MRPRILRLHYKTVEKLHRLKKEAEHDGAYRVAKRIHSVLLNSGGRTSGEIADILDAPLSRVSQWLRDYEKQGYDGILEGYRSGRNPKLSEEQKNALGDIIDSGPVAYGFLSGVWSSPMITRVIEEEFKITYHPGHVRKLLNQLGFSVQRPTRLLAKADKEKQDRWHRYTYPAIKKKADSKEPP
jgi:transposase|tara:strand:- start:356 stop:907 length:552 start_codon:yes stop_codon:yes gene_type:complete